MLSLLPLALSPLGCASDPVPPTLRTIVDPLPCRQRPETLMVLLPGSRSPIEEFITEGFVRTVREQGLAVDLNLVDAGVPYYQNRSVTKRLHADVIAPSRLKHGYTKRWLVGISIGAVGAMLYARDRPEDVDGVVLIAPFLGARLTALEIRNGGGLQRWPAHWSTEDSDLDANLWTWLRAQADPANPRAIPVYLAYGESDRFAYNQEVLAAALPPSRVFTEPGSHDWDAWRPLWKRIVAALPIARAGACSAG
jgi:pimeloyl-ACP methyl ester carboxylesterase